MAHVALKAQKIFIIFFKHKKHKIFTQNQPWLPEFPVASSAL